MEPPSDRRESRAEAPPAVVVALWVVAFALWWSLMLTQSRYLARWDSAQFALAFEHLDVRLHQPHPPGYPLYVGSAWLLKRILMGEANMALLGLNFLLTGAGACATYLLGKRLGGTVVGLCAAILLLASPLTRYYTDVALSYPAGLCLFAWIGYACWRVGWEGDKRWWWPVVLAAIGGAFRVPTLVLALPLLIKVAWTWPWGRKIAAAAMGLAILGAAYGPVIAASGGWTEYRAASAIEGVKHEVRLGRLQTGPLNEVVTNIRVMGSFVWEAFPWSALLLVGFFIRRPESAGRRPSTEQDREDGLQSVAEFFAWWVLPAVAFYTIIHVNLSGIFLDFSPAIALLIVLGVARVAPQRPLATIIAALAGGAVSLALFYQPLAPQGVGAPLIRSVDELMMIHTGVLPASCVPSQTLFLTGESFKQDGYYLPSMRIVWDKYLLRARGPVEMPILTMQGHQLEPWVLEGERINGIPIRYMPFPKGTRFFAFDAAALPMLAPHQRAGVRTVPENGAHQVQLMDVEGALGLVLAPELGWMLVRDETERQAAFAQLGAMAASR